MILQDINDPEYNAYCERLHKKWREAALEEERAERAYAKWAMETNNGFGWSGHSPCAWGGFDD